MAVNGQTTCRYSLRYVFKPHDSGQNSGDISVSIESTSNNPEDHKDEAFAQLARMYGLPNRQEATNRWSVKAVHIGFANAPWDDFDELENALESMPGVKRVRYEDPYEGAYQPPKYHLYVENSRAVAVEMAVQKYYSGLTTQVRNKGYLQVLVSATA